MQKKNCRRTQKNNCRRTQKNCRNDRSEFEEELQKNTNTTVETMNLQKTQLNEEGAEILAKAFRSASNLTDVDLSENSIRAYGDGAIANALPCSSIVLYIFLFIRILPRCLAHASVAASRPKSRPTLATQRHPERGEGSTLVGAPKAWPLVGASHNVPGS